MTAMDPSERKRQSRAAAYAKRPERARRTPRPDPDPSWREQAACVDHDRDLWYSSPEGEHRHDRPKNDGEKAAIAICHTCPVASKCLTYALNANETDGIFGGFTADERRRFKRRGGR